MSVETCKCVSCNDELCPHDDTLITKPKYTGWNDIDDKRLKNALDLIGLDTNETWTAMMRLSGVSRICIEWIMEDIEQAKMRIKAIVDKSINHFTDDKKMV